MQDSPSRFTRWGRNLVEVTFRAQDGSLRSPRALLFEPSALPPLVWVVAYTRCVRTTHSVTQGDTTMATRNSNKVLIGEVRHSRVGTTDHKGDFVPEVDRNGKPLTSDNIVITVAKDAPPAKARVSALAMRKLAEKHNLPNIAEGVDYVHTKTFPLESRDGRPEARWEFFRPVSEGDVSELFA